MKSNINMAIMYISNSRFSSKFKGCSPLQLWCGMKVKNPAVGYYS